jgi:hypothetical protein
VYSAQIQGNVTSLLGKGGFTALNVTVAQRKKSGIYMLALTFDDQLC